MDIRFDLYYNMLIIRVNGDMDHHSSDEIMDKIENEINSSNAKNIIFDMKNVSFVDSAGINVIVRCFKIIMLKGGKSAIFNMQLQFKRVYDVLKLKRIIPEYANERMAIDSIKT